MDAVGDDNKRTERSGQRQQRREGDSDHRQTCGGMSGQLTSALTTEARDNNRGSLVMFCLFKLSLIKAKLSLIELIEAS